MGEVIQMDVCGVELRSQLDRAFGVEFSLRALMHNIQERSLFNEARGVVNGFVNETDTKMAISRTHANSKFVPRIELDYDEVSECAEFQIEIFDPKPDETSRVDICLSPNAVKSLYVPVDNIVDYLYPGENSVISKERIIAHVVRAVYSKTLTEFMFKQQLREAVSNPVIMEKYSMLVNEIYEPKFGDDKIKDLNVRLDRISMAVGGAVMYRHVIDSLGHEFDGDSGAEELRMAQLLKMYAMGLRTSKNPVDQQSVTFSLVHAFSPTEVAGIFKRWFV